MKSKLIILRGNSGCGKATTAVALQHTLGAATLLVSQDVVRRDRLLMGSIWRLLQKSARLPNIRINDVSAQLLRK